MPALMDLPPEIVIQILSYVFPPWVTTMSITCQLSPIPNIGLLRTCKFFYKEGMKALRKSFTGEFIRYDRRGCIVNTALEPKEWYSWIMQHTTVLHLYDGYFTIWYIDNYWEYYPALKGFYVSILQEQTYNVPEVEMPDFEERQQRCELRTARFANADYSLQPYLFDEMFVVIYKDMKRHARSQWPTVEYRYHGCRCHPERQTVFKIRHTNIDKNAGLFIDEAFEASALHVTRHSRNPLHKATVNCVALSNKHGFPKSLGIVNTSAVVVQGT